MAIIINFVLSGVFSLGVIAFTSPTSPFTLLIDNGEYAIVTYRCLASVVDLTLAMLVSFLLLCSLEHKWIAKNRSFPYVFHPIQNLGAEALGFQLVIYETYHLHYWSRTIHSITLLLEEAVWLFIIRGTFSAFGLAFVNALLLIQALTYGDKVLASCITTINILFSLASFILFQAFSDSTILLDVSKISLILLVSLRTASHAMEPLPPAYDYQTRTFERGFKGRVSQLLTSNTLYAVWLFIFGVIQEMGAGIPGRLFNVVVAKCMYSMGYRSQSVLDVGVAKERAYLISDEGWEVNPISRQLFSWAARESCDLPV